jgi:hypothetical protein
MMTVYGPLLAPVTMATLFNIRPVILHEKIAGAGEERRGFRRLLNFVRRRFVMST